MAIFRGSSDSQLKEALRHWDGRNDFHADQVSDPKTAAKIADELKAIRRAFLSDRLPPHASLSDDLDFALGRLRQKYPDLNPKGLKLLEQDYLAANCHG